MKKRIIIIISIILLQLISIKQIYAAINISQNSIIVGVDYIRKLSTSGEVSKVSWYSSDEDIATVTDGVVYGVSPGIAYITATDGESTAVCKITVTNYYVPVDDIILSKTSETLSINSKSKIEASISPSSASNKKISFLSSNPSIVSVDSDGYITAKRNGTAYISINAENITKSYKVTVVNNVTISLKNISIQQNISINEGETKSISVTYTPSNATNKKITWKSSNTGIVTVDSNGNIKGISPGEASITATSIDGNHIATSKIKVLETDKSLKEISLNKTELKLKVGEEENLSVNYFPSNAENKEVTWSCDNEDIVKIKNGKVKALKPGTAEVKVVSEDGKKEAICKVTVVSDPIESISFSDESITIYVGNTVTLVTNSVPENTAIENPIWTSSDEEVATVKNGVIKAKKIGTTIVTISNESNTITASIEIKVITKPEEKLLITIDGYDLNFDSNTKNYTLSIGNETSLNIHVNRSEDKFAIGGNRDLKNGSIITVTVNHNTKTTYVINIKKKQNYTYYFIGIISVLLFINIIRLLIKNKKKK